MKKLRVGYKRKRKYHGNQHSKKPEENKKRKKTDQLAGTCDASSSTSSGNQTQKLSASARKIHLEHTNVDVEKITSQKSKVSGFRFVDLEILASVYEQLPCKECFKLTLTLVEEIFKRKGCASALRLVCSSCGWSSNFSSSKQVNRIYEINRRLVYAMRSIGCGHAAAKRFCGIMNMPPPPRPTPYSRHSKALLKVVRDIASESLSESAKEIHTLNSGSQSDTVKCAVSCDGTWQKRGFSSLNGCVSVITMETGKIIDVEPMSKICWECKRHANDRETPEYEMWKADHKSSCKANYSGSAPAMEPEGALRIFKRSIDKHNIQNNEYFGDGDSKSYNVVKDVYKEHNVEVVKKECVGHVQKRLGTALRKLKKEKKLGGSGKLTDSIIDKLQNYYGIAIRSNPGDLPAMKKAIYASLFHCASSETRDLHQHCPEGKDSWCGLMRDKANKAKTYKHGPGLPLAVIAELKPVYLRLSEDSLLSRCLDCKTQNQNEKWNGMVWERVPKTICVAKDVLELGVYDAVAHFNMGSKAVIKVFEKQNIEPGQYCLSRCDQADYQRVSKANYQAQSKTKTRRKVLRGIRKKRGDKNKEKEGETYASGQF